MQIGFLSFQLSYHVNNDLIDIESTTEQSESFSIYLFGDTKRTQPISLPIHFRYHAPANKSFVVVNIDLPHIFLEYDVHTNHTVAIHSVMCPDRRHRCRWYEIEYEVSAHCADSSHSIDFDFLFLRPSAELFKAIAERKHSDWKCRRQWRYNICYDCIELGGGHSHYLCHTK